MYRMPGIFSSHASAKARTAVQSALARGKR